MRRPTVLVPLDQTMQLPLTLAGRLRTTFAGVVCSPLRGRLGALVSRLQADRNERSGEQRKWGHEMSDRKGQFIAICMFIGAVTMIGLALTGALQMRVAHSPVVAV